MNVIAKQAYHAVTSMPGCHLKDGSVPHWHDNEQILVMVSGMCKLTIDGKIFDAYPGDLLFFPAGPRQCAIGTEPKGCVYYKIFAPARPDQLPGWIGPSVLRYD
ncbi:MAG: cupin domain-containing protein [Mesorhizobium sp.]|nr:MAG: cupin domain-containing protein [Mesorhizobium sp.]